MNNTQKTKINFGKLWQKPTEVEANIHRLSKEKTPPIERFGGIEELVDVFVEELRKYDTEIKGKIEEFELGSPDGEYEYEIAAQRYLVSWATYFIVEDALLWSPNNPDEFAQNLCHGMIVKFYYVDIDKSNEAEIDRYKMYWQDIYEDHIAFKEILEEKLVDKINSAQYFVRTVYAVFKDHITDWSPELATVTIMSPYHVILKILNTTLLQTVDAVNDNNLYLG